ncbi:DNA/RNA polymerases superfamily protein [Gossypium australe]|uniref:DNA/RNA polymerases superfamily protein n=1 Tax=Gossypium australe TaxID=47621 RepID=A0A5B6X351_9ROSI|nr:DNA/RNA polymerases superfamily protein [Gossypium australe]
MLIEAPVLTHLESRVAYVVYSDASLNSLGCVLVQARKLKLHENDCPTHDLELVVIVMALKIWRHYLCGKNVTCLRITKRRWLELLKNYDLVIDYHPGKTNVVADALNRKSSLFALQVLNAHLALNEDGSVLTDIDDDGMLHYHDRICVPNDLGLKRDILSEAHICMYSIHLGSIKMYCDLK